MQICVRQRDFYYRGGAAQQRQVIKPGRFACGNRGDPSWSSLRTGTESKMNEQNIFVREPYWAFDHRLVIAGSPERLHQARGWNASRLRDQMGDLVHEDVPQHVGNGRSFDRVPYTIIKNLAMHCIKRTADG